MFTKFSTADLILLGMVILLVVPGLAWKLDRFPPLWYDEGYKTNAAWTLAQTGIYGSSTSEGIQPYDPGISSGPLDILGMAISFRFFGAGPLQARGVIVIFAVLGLVAFYRLGERTFGRFPALLAVFLLLAMPSMDGINYLMLGRQALGEIPAYAFTTLGWLLWMEGWEKRHWPVSLAAGICIGLGLLSKTQLAIPLLPALGLACLVAQVDTGGPSLEHRSLRVRLRPLDWLTWLPFSGIIACLAGWGALSAALTPQEAAAANYANLLDSIHTTLWTGLFGKTLNQTAWLVVVFFLIVAVVGIFTTRMRVAVQPLTPVQRWSRVGLYAFLFFDLAWYAFISIGWVRYAFAGLFMAALVSGEPHWELIKVVSRGLKPRLAWAKPERLALVACIGLFGFGVANHLVVVAVSPGSGDAVQMANTIQELVPQHALVESWEWELDFLSGDRVYHHPTQNYLFLAIRQRFHENAAFTLGYNALQADPDYLVVGPFADWTTIYADALSGQDFQEVRQVGVYTLYKRVR